MLKTSIFKTIHDYAIREQLYAPGDTIIIALSGGPDSLFLLHFFLSLRTTYNLTLIAAHLDHGWRADSRDDSAFCQRVCDEYAVPLITQHMRDIVVTRKQSGSPEDAARQARRVFFESAVAEYRANALAMAHHQDDLVETFFIRLIRGAGLSGLASIRPRQGIYIRPLLIVDKAAILDYLTQHKITYCVDSTNSDINFLRNKIRHTLMPVYRAVDGRAYTNLVRTIDQLQRADSSIDATAERYYQQMVDGGGLAIDAFATYDLFFQHRILLCWLRDASVAFTPTEAFFAEIVRFLTVSVCVKHSIAVDWYIQKRKKRAYIVPCR